MNMAFDLKQILLALLFSSSEPLSIKEIQAVINRFHQQEADVSGGEDGGQGPPPVEPAVPSLVTASQIRAAMDQIRSGLEEKGEVFQLIEGHHGYRLVTRPEFADWIRCLRGEPRPARLSQAALETLSIVAYRQPVTRAEIESIRGVSADNALSRLIEKDLIEIQGRADLPGRPIQYGVSERFLEWAGVRSLEELPASDVLSPRQIDEWIQKAANPVAVTDKEVGLPEE